tara:strand:- start:504 stop:830 length:327 start_codon:yes stop_codon:yes gene_type:complete
MKIIYNVTINIANDVHDEWLIWIKEHIPQVLGTGKFESALMTKVLVEEEMDAQTYSIQYTSYSREALDAYYRDDAENLKKEGLKRFADKMLAFRTELEVLDTYAVNFK